MARITSRDNNVSYRMDSANAPDSHSASADRASTSYVLRCRKKLLVLIRPALRARTRKTSFNSFWSNIYGDTGRIKGVVFFGVTASLQKRSIFLIFTSAHFVCLVCCGPESEWAKTVSPNVHNRSLRQSQIEALLTPKSFLDVPVHLI